MKVSISILHDFGLTKWKSIKKSGSKVTFERRKDGVQLQYKSLFTCTALLSLPHFVDNFDRQMRGNLSDPITKPNTIQRFMLLPQKHCLAFNFICVSIIERWDETLN